MPVKTVKAFLDSNAIKYITITHSLAYTAQEAAAVSHIPGKELAKTVMIKIDGYMAMAVLPASCQIDFHMLKKSIGAGIVELAAEQEFKDKFSGCDLGAMPPFGNLYGMKVYVDSRLKEDEEIAFAAGSHTELIRMSYKDFERLVKPQIVRFSCL